ncbi:hypothetical protein ACWCO0_09590 [Streptomyces tubercidicus]
MTMEDLIKAGAPALPAGMFYRVRDTHLVGLRVSVRERRRIGSREVPGAYAFVYPEEHATVGAAVANACRRAVRDMREELADRARHTAARAYLGDHNPREKR